MAKMNRYAFDGTITTPETLIIEALTVDLARVELEILYPSFTETTDSKVVTRRPWYEIDGAMPDIDDDDEGPQPFNSNTLPEHAESEFCDCNACQDVRFCRRNNV